MASKYEGKTREDLIKIIGGLNGEVTKLTKQVDPLMIKVDELQVELAEFQEDKAETADNVEFNFDMLESTPPEKLIKLAQGMDHQVFDFKILNCETTEAGLRLVEGANIPHNRSSNTNVLLFITTYCDGNVNTISHTLPNHRIDTNADGNHTIVHESTIRPKAKLV